MKEVECVHKWSNLRKCLAEEKKSSEFHKTLHKFRVMICSLPIKKTNYRWRICDRNQAIGWNECRLEMLKQIGNIHSNPDLITRMEGE